MNQKIEKVKKHFCDNKKVYLGVGAGLIVAGVTSSRMSKHLNGHVDQINGLHYEIIGLGTV